MATQTEEPSASHGLWGRFKGLASRLQFCPMRCPFPCTKRLGVVNITVCVAHSPVWPFGPKSQVPHSVPKLVGPV